VTPQLESLERLGDALAQDRPVERKRMLVVINPYATTMSDRLRTLVVYALQGRYDVDAVDTQARGHAIELVREAKDEGYDVVLAFGGDGTVNEAANGLAGSSTPLTCLPGGATNVFCKLLGIPGDIVDATEHLLAMADTFTPRRVDLPFIGDRAFTFSSGVGLDAAVVRTVDAHPGVKTRLRQWYYAQSAISTFVKEYMLDPPRLVVEADGVEQRGITALVQNGPALSYFGDKPLFAAEGVTLDDGHIAGVLLERAGPIAIPSIAARLLSQRLRVLDSRRVSAFGPTTEVVVRSEDGRAVPVEVDGDYLGDVEEARFTVRPGALTVVS
jgi:diacylglycerol kinase family enzyme